jgi:hypothetical protein
MAALLEVFRRPRDKTDVATERRFEVPYRGGERPPIWLTTDEYVDVARSVFSPEGE